MEFSRLSWLRVGPATLLSVLLALAATDAAAAKDCKKGKKLCGGRCISAKKPCAEDGAAAAAPGGPKCKKGQKVCGDRCIPAKGPCTDGATASAAPGLTCKKGQKVCGDRCIPAKKACADAPAPSPSGKTAASAEPTAALLATPPGQAMMQLARALQKSNALDVDDKQREALRQSLRGAKPPLPLCDSSQNLLVKGCEQVIGGTLTLPCTLAVEEIAGFCKERTGATMACFR